MKKQLCYLKRDVRYIGEVIFKIGEFSDELPVIPSKLLNWFGIIKEVYEQQDYMYRKKINKVDSIIVCISQPHVRPIVRGKSGKVTAKISLSLSDGFSFIDNLSWEAFNESKDLIEQIEKYKQRYGYYPGSVHADKIYQTRDNRNYYKRNNIRSLWGGRPRKRKRIKRDCCLKKSSGTSMI